MHENTFIAHAKAELERGATIEHDENAGTYTIVRDRYRMPLTQHKYEQLCEAIGRPLVDTPNGAPERQTAPQASDPVQATSLSKKPAVGPPRANGSELPKDVAYSDEMIERVGKMKETMSYREIADATGLAMKQVSYALTKYRSRAVGPKPTPPPVQQKSEVVVTSDKPVTVDGIVRSIRQSIQYHESELLKLQTALSALTLPAR